MKFSLGKKVLLFQLLGCIFFLVPVRSGAYHPLYVVSRDSMSPGIPAGSLLLVSNRPLARSEDYLQRVIVFYDPLQGKIVAHRAIGRQGKYFVTKGDNNFFVDAFRPDQAFVLGYAVLAVAPEILFNILMAGMVALMIIAGIWGWRATRSIKKEPPAPRQKGRRGFFTPTSSLAFGNAVLFFLLVALAVQVWVLRGQYLRVLGQRDFGQEQAGVKYRIIVGEPGKSILIVGDVLGTNILAARALREGFFLKDHQGTQIIVPSLLSRPLKGLSLPDVLAAISTEAGVVLADNFCFPEWDKIKERPLFAGTTLTPGPYCFSEPQTLLIDNLIKAFQVKEVLVVYDTENYLDMAQTFLNYLSQKGIPCRTMGTAFFLNPPL